MEGLTLTLFCAALLLCIVWNISILYALAAGLALFWVYGRREGCSWRELAVMSLDGVKTVKNILITFVLIGVLTAFWRAAGTIPVIVCYASSLIRPSVFILMAFLLNCAVSFLTGTAFGTSATMGVICGAVGVAMGVDIRLTGGAVLSGAYFGDRCSPVSTSALLVAELTGTNIYDNIRRMFRSAFVPLLLSCAAYAAMGLFSSHDGHMPDLYAVFGREFVLHWAALAPAVVILSLASLRVNVKAAMTASILTAVPLCLFLQGITPKELIKIAVFGFRASDAGVGAMANGGGLISMLNVGGIVCLSSSYSGIFHRTKLLNGSKHAVEALAARTTDYAAMLCASIAAGMAACNQTLTTMLTEQLCAGLKKDQASFANDLEDTAVVTSPLVPWSIGAGVCLAAVGAPLTSIPFAYYLYLITVWRLARSFATKAKLH